MRNNMKHILITGALALLAQTVPAQTATEQYLPGVTAEGAIYALPKTAVRIHRAVPEVGERMSVAVMTFDTKGELQNRCSFAEGRSEINSGEEGAGVLAKREADAAKKAAETAEMISIEEGDEEEEEDAGDSAEDSGSDDEEASSGDEEEDLF